MLRAMWRWLRRGLTLAMLVLLLTRMVPADPDKPGAVPPAAKGKHTNRLARETSPYLLQHAHNPVAWYPWGEEAFAKAKKEGKLVFLSIGYSSCHWCHVMERESFENEEIAKILNRDFVCIKVDREERPDIDNVYMTAIHVMFPRQNGGWPLSMFLTAEGKPIYGGTYWPPEDKEVDGGKVRGFKTILKIVQDTWTDKRKEVQESADQIAEATGKALEGLRAARRSWTSTAISSAQPWMKSRRVSIPNMAVSALLRGDSEGPSSPRRPVSYSFNTRRGAPRRKTERKNSMTWSP